MAKKIYKASDVANYFIYLSSQTRIGDNKGEVEGITNLKLQKILYFAQAYYLSKIGRSLFDDKIQAWEYGPVVPSVYGKYKKFGRDSIINNENPKNISEEDKKNLDQIWEIFGGYSTGRLVNISHAHSPWKDAYESGQKVIPNKVIAEYYTPLFK